MTSALYENNGIGFDLKTPVPLQAVVNLKKSIWLYFALLVIEGGLRKWVLPGLATPLLLVRDPVALWIIYISWKNNLFPFSGYIVIAIITVLISSLTAIGIGHGNILVALYGARIMLFHFPLIFIIGKIFSKPDVLKIGKAILIVSIPMVILLSLQFYSPQSAFVNRGVGGDLAGSGFDGALGYYRPSGTFSFTTGTALFFGLAACFICYFWLHPGSINIFLLTISSASLLCAIPLSISRTLLFYIVCTLLFTAFAATINFKYLKKIILIPFIVLPIILLLYNTSFFQKATEVFFARFSNASKMEGGLQGTLIERYFGSMFKSIVGSFNIPFFGYGSGLGTNAGSQLLTGNRQFLLAEDEWGRIIGECGLLVGLLVILIRLSLSLKLAIVSFKNLVAGNSLPWILLSFGILVLPQGQWAQATTLGFAVFTGGLVIAAMSREC